MREREREAGCSAGCRLVVSEVGAATSRGAQAGEGSIIKQWIAKSCICHTHNSLSLPPSVFISGMLLFTPCCLKPVSQTDSPVSLSPLSLYLSKLSPADLHMIRVRACSVSLSRHACMFLSFFLSIFSPLSLSLFSHLKSF